MKTALRFAISLILISAFLTNALPCGPGYVSPVFDFSKSPQHPYSDFAGGQLGIIKPDFHRSVLFAAYRYLNGGSFSQDDQTAMIELWKETIDRDYTQKDEISDAVRVWVEKRKDVVGKEEKTPDIYVERSYGGYDFFPNCTRNAFETAAETLTSRIGSSGPGDANIQNWVNGQDQVFQNCSNGKRTPEDVPPGAPVWLQKDRAYQKAAAEFYSLDYKAAKAHFAEIAQDTDSPWAETADYLVARTLIRQASLLGNPDVADPLYDEAEGHLQRFVSRSGKFAASAERLEGLVRYRRHPKERVGELARKLAQQTANENFKQDLIDYTWLLDKFEGESLEAETKRKQAIEAAKNGSANANKKYERPESEIAASNTAPAKVPDDKLQFTIYSENYAQNWVITIPLDATDEQALAEAEKVVGKPLNDAIKKSVREERQGAYSRRFTEQQTSSYQGGYYGDDPLVLGTLPSFLRVDELTDWLYTYQTATPEAYTYSLKRFRDSGTDLWLMTAISKAQKDSVDLPRLIEAAERVSSISPGYFTVAYHRARLLLETGKSVEAKKLIDEILGDSRLQIATRNSFTALRLRLAETLEDFLTYSLRRPFAFDFDGDVGSIDELIARQKAYYDPEYHKDGREAFDKEVEDRYKVEKLWEDRQMLDSETIDLMNRAFPQTLLLQVQTSPALPDYLRRKFVIAIWTRAYLLDDMATLVKLTPELIKYNPDMEPQLSKVTAATTQTAIDHAVLFFILKNPEMSPYLEEGMGKTDNEFGQWDSNDWWCSQYLDGEGDEESSIERPVLKTPKFLTAAQKQTAAVERKKLILLGDAPELLAKRVLDWARRYPTDKRVQEALYIVYEANGWTKYGCGSNEELQKSISVFMKKNYPNSGWTRKLDAEKEADADEPK